MTLAFIRFDVNGTDLEVKAHIEIHVAISFGLEIFASVLCASSIAMEEIMENSKAIYSTVVASVWCGIALLRSSGEKKFQPK